MTTVELRGIGKTFGGFTAIRDMNLKIDEGEFVCLVGPSGCGKSTLLRMVSGLEDPTEGEILFSGTVVNDDNPRARNVAMVFQNYALYPHLTVEENIGFNLRIAGVPKAQRAEKVRAVADLLDLGELLSRRPAELSGGQRQRVAMGRAIVRQPAVFLFDEPLSNLDAKLRVQMRSEIKRLHRRFPTTSIYVTHDQIEAMTLADRVVIMNKGKIEQAGRPLDLYNTPQTTFVAGFIGSPPMNLIEATVRAGSGGAPVAVGRGITFRLPTAIEVSDGQEVVVGIRPEHLTPAEAGQTIVGRIVQIEPTGGQVSILFDVGGLELLSVVNSDWLGAVDDEFCVGIRPDSLHVFDAGTSQRVTQR